MHALAFSHQKKFRMSRSKAKVTLIVFIDAKDVENHEFVPEGQSVTVAFYLEVLKRLKKNVNRVRPCIAVNPKLYYDNAPSNTRFRVNEYLVRNGSTKFLSPSTVPNCFRLTYSSSSV